MHAFPFEEFLIWLSVPVLYCSLDLTLKTRWVHTKDRDSNVLIWCSDLETSIIRFLPLMGEMKTWIWAKKQMPDVSCRSLDPDSYLTFPAQTPYYWKKTSPNNSTTSYRDGCIFLQCIPDPASIQSMNSCQPFSGQVIVPDNLFMPLGRQSHCHLLVKSGTTLDFFSKQLIVCWKDWLFNIGRNF